MCKCTGEVWIGQSDSQRTVDVEGGSCVDDTGCSTVVLSVRHISEWRTEHATHHMDGVRSCDTSQYRHTETSKRSRTARSVTVHCGMWSELSALRNFRLDFVLYWTLTSVYKWTL